MPTKPKLLKVPSVEERIQSLRVRFRWHVACLLVAGLLYVLAHSIMAMRELTLLLCGVLFVYYLLLEPVNWVEGFFNRILPRESTLNLLPAGLKQLPLPKINRRTLATLLVFLAFVTSIALAAAGILPTVARQVKHFGTDLPHYYQSLQGYLLGLQETSLSPGVAKLLGFTEPSEASTAPSPSNTSLPQTPQTANAAEPPPPQVSVKIDWTLTEEPGITGNAPEPQALPLGPVVTMSAKLPDETQPKAPQSVTPLDNLVTVAQQFATSAFSNVFEIITGGIAGLVYSFTGLVLLFYFLLDSHKLRDGFIYSLPASAQPIAIELIDATHALFYRFIRLQVLFALCSGLLLYGLYTLFGVKYAGFLSVFFGLFAVIPTIGPWIGAAPSIIVLLFSGEPALMLVLFSLLGGIYLIKQQWLVPKLFDEGLDLHPVMMIIALLIGFHLAGNMGLLAFLIAVPLACFITVLGYVVARHNNPRRLG